MIGLLAMLAAGGVFNTGNDLYNSCQADPHGACAAYVAGVWDEIQVLQAMNQTKMRWICSSANVTMGQARDIVVKALHDEPETRDQYAAALASVALSKAFPCR